MTRSQDFLTPLARAERLLAVRLATLERDLETDPEKWGPAMWDAYLHALDVYLRVLQRVAPDPLLTTAQVAERFGVSPRTIRRRQAKGELEPAVNGRGRGGSRWGTS